jgi:hypothetical protein
MSSFTITACEAERRVAAVCRSAEAESVQQQLINRIEDPAQAYQLWLFWAQWRATGREAMSHHTELSPWAVADRLRRLREAGVPVLSWSVERDLIARGRFYSE